MEKKDDVMRYGLVRPESSTEYSRTLLRLPVPREAITECGSAGISPAHQGNYSNAIDFYVPEGTIVRASSGGVVVRLLATSNEHGIDVRYWDKGNFIELFHRDTGEYTWYEHLGYKDVFVKPGDTIREDQIIALSGNTGFSEKPHLHFQVHRYICEGHESFVTLKARFVDFPDIYANPRALLRRIQTEQRE